MCILEHVDTQVKQVDPLVKQEDTQVKQVDTQVEQADPLVKQVDTQVEHVDLLVKQVDTGRTDRHIGKQVNTGKTGRHTRRTGRQTGKTISRHKSRAQCFWNFRFFLFLSQNS